MYNVNVIRNQYNSLLKTNVMSTDTFKSIQTTEYDKRKQKEFEKLRDTINSAYNYDLPV